MGEDGVKKKSGPDENEAWKNHRLENGVGGSGSKSSEERSKNVPQVDRGQSRHGSAWGDADKYRHCESRGTLALRTVRSRASLD